MYQILLVDDEPLVHHDLAMLIDWPRHGFKLCPEAYSGEMALEILAQSPPNIMIIDVNMPGMNGVELNRVVKKRFPAVQTLMLSSYDDYDYVRECLKDGAADYLLKHRLDGPSLLAVLNKVTDVLEQESSGGRRMMSGTAGEQVHPVQLREWIAEAVRGNAEAGERLVSVAAASGLYAGAVSYVTAVVQIQSFLLLTETFSDVQTIRMVQRTVEMMQQSLGDLFERSAAYIGGGRFVVVFSFRHRSEHRLYSEVHGMMGKLLHVVEMYMNLKCVYSIGYICASLPQIAGSANEAMRKLDHIFGVGTNDPRGAAPVRTSLTMDEQKQLLLSLENLDPEGIRRTISAIFSSLRNLPVYSLAVQSIVSEMLRIAAKAHMKWAADASDDAGKGELPSRADLAQIGDLREMERRLQEYFAKLLQLLKDSRVKGRYSRHVSQAVQYILDHYREGITLEQAASEIGLNPSYLSRIFKIETQATFSEFLNKVRIDAGRRLLESGRYTIKEVSHLVGFSTYNYFFKVFKEATGMTPQAYVQNGGRETRS
jgi:two-component system response regulator YesN